MTLILTSLASWGVLQVADRLVIQEVPGASPKPYESRSNKSVLFAAHDAVVAISYTGAAHLDRVNTDQWITEVLRGKRVERGPNRRPVAFAFETMTNWPSLGQALARLQSVLGPAVKRLPPRPKTVRSVRVVIAGWQFYRRKPPRPAGYVLAASSDQDGVDAMQSRRHLGRCAALITEPDRQLSVLEQQALAERIASSTGAEATAVMVETVRMVSDRNPMVGKQCVCIKLPPPSLGWAEIEYSSPDQEYAGFVTEQGRSELIPVVFGPWIIANGLTMAPAVLGGSEPSNVRIGPYALTIRGPLAPPGSSRIAFHYSQPRRSPP